MHLYVCVYIYSPYIKLTAYYFNIKSNYQLRQVISINMPHNKSMDAAAETASTDSLSFAGLICNQDQQNNNIICTNVIPKEDVNDFEFTSFNNKSVVVDVVMLSNDSTVPKADKLHASNKHKIQLAQVIEHDGEYSKGSSTSGARNKANKQQGSVSRWFGSLVTPCRDCRAVEPSTSIQQPYSK